MNEKSKIIWIGIFIIGAFLILGWFLLLLRPTLGDGKQHIHVRFSNIDMISIGTRVTFAGKPVGKVHSISQIVDARNLPANEYGDPFFWQLCLRVDSRVKVYSYDQIVFSSSGFMGERSIAIVPKEAPTGGPAAIEVTNEILFAKGGDKIDDAIHQLTNVSITFDNALSNINSLVAENREEIKNTITSFHNTSDNIGEFFCKMEQNAFVDVATQTFDSLNHLLDEAIDHHLIEHLDCAVANICEITDSLKEGDKLSKTVSNLYAITSQIATGTGTLGRLIYSDAFYLQLLSTLRRIETLSSDISNYGLLFQFSKKWQRNKYQRLQQEQTLCNGSDVCSYFNEEFGEINVSLSRIAMVMERLDCNLLQEDNAAISCRLKALLENIKNLEGELSQCREKACCY